jgi:hypothetical protein
MFNNGSMYIFNYLSETPSEILSFRLKKDAEDD